MDKISQLSDDLLIKILSLIPTKDAVAMSVVSKRWMTLWTLVPRLIFDDYFEEDEDEDEESNENHDRSLSQFVSGTLLLHKAAVLESFHLNIASECSASEIGLWVRIVVDRFVRDLKISFYYDHGLVMLPSRLFRCETIETLELDRVITFEVPSRFSVRSLKKLLLLSVRYSDEESFSRLISNCPVLEDLAVETCKKDNVVTFTVNVASLQSLSIGNTLREEAIFDEVFVIHCHSLILFFLIMIASSEARYPTGTVLSQLLCLELCSCEDNWKNILKQNHCVAVHRNVCWFQPNCVPKCLLFHLKTFEWRDYGGTGIEKAVAMYILKNSKQLVTATIYPDSVKLVRKLKMFVELEIASRGSRACELTMG